jgi:hypothetical protein
MDRPDIVERAAVLEVNRLSLGCLSPKGVAEGDGRPG